MNARDRNMARKIGSKWKVGDTRGLDRIAVQKGLPFAPHMDKQQLEGVPSSRPVTMPVGDSPLFMLTEPPQYKRVISFRSDERTLSHPGNLYPPARVVAAKRVNHLYAKAFARGPTPRRFLDNREILPPVHLRGRNQKDVPSNIQGSWYKSHQRAGTAPGELQTTKSRI